MIKWVVHELKRRLSPPFIIVVVVFIVFDFLMVFLIIRERLRGWFHLASVNDRCNAKCAWNLGNLQ